MSEVSKNSNFFNCPPKRVHSTSTDQHRPKQKFFRSCKRTASAPHFKVDVRKWDLFREKVRVLHDHHVIAFRIQGGQDELPDDLPRPSGKWQNPACKLEDASDRRRCKCSPWSSMTLHAHEKKSSRWPHDHAARAHPVSQRKAQTKLAYVILENLLRFEKMFTSAEYLRYCKH